MKKIITLLFAVFTVQVCSAQCSPAFTFNISPTGTALLNVNFTNTTVFTPTGTEYVTYTMDFGDGTSAGMYTTVSHNYATAGTYNAVLTMNVVDSATSSCTNTATSSIPVTAYPVCGTVITSTIVSATSTSEIVNFGSSTPSGSTMTTFDWDFGDGSPHDYTATPTHTYTSSGNYTVTLLASNATTCGTPWNTTTDINVTSVFDCTADIITSMYAVPTTTDKTISYGVGYTPPGAGQMCTFSWDFGDGSTSTTPSGTYTYGAATAYATPITVTATVNWLADSAATIGCTHTSSTSVTLSPVAPPNRISGHIIFPTGCGPIDTGSSYVEVYLITYDAGSGLLLSPSNVYAHSDGTGNFYYEFDGASPDHYRVKASVNYATPPAYGYVPTYYATSPAWNDGATMVVDHTSGGTNDGNDITLICGTPSSGPGFVGGYVTTSGVGRGTSGNIPAAGLLMFARNFITGQLMQSTYTDSTGHYAFSNLPVDQTYYVYPELINYSSVPYSGITLTSSATSMSSASFVKHDVAKTILPVNTTGVQNVNALTSSILAFPNPTAGKINIQWEQSVSENGKVIITDITGREVYTNAINITQGFGTQQIDLSGMENGLYIISIKSASISYKDKIQVLH